MLFLAVCRTNVVRPPPVFLWAPGIMFRMEEVLVSAEVRCTTGRISVQRLHKSAFKRRVWPERMIRLKSKRFQARALPGDGSRRHGVCGIFGVKHIIETLLKLQQLAPPGAPIRPQQQTTLQQLRATVPVPVLAHFDRMAAWGKKGVALVRHGVCGECHMRVPTATVASLVSPRDLYLCESCSCYLLLPPEEIPLPSVPLPPPVRKKRGVRELALT